MVQCNSVQSSQDIGKMRENAGFDRSRIHLDHAGASFLSSATVARMQQHLKLEEAICGYVAQERVMDELESVYQTLADCFGGGKDDYALTSSAVDSWNRLFYSVPINKGQNIVTTHTEYCSNYIAMLHDSEKRGFEIRVAHRLPNGDVDLDHLESLIDDQTALLSVTWIGSSSGQILPAQKIGQIANRKNVLYLLDACQAFGHIYVDLDVIGCDMASGTARKFLRGPRGIGFLYAGEHARSVMRPVMMTNQSASWTQTNQYECRTDARLFEAWERSVMNVLGFGVALSEFKQTGMQALTDQTLATGRSLREKLYSQADIISACPQGAEGAIITFNKQGWSAVDIKSKLETMGIAVNVASVVHTRLDLEGRGIDTAVRVSPHYLTLQSECDRFLDALGAL